MFEMVKAIHEALHIESTWAFVFVVSAAFALMSGSVAWIVDKGYRNSPEFKQELAERLEKNHQETSVIAVPSSQPSPAMSDKKGSSSLPVAPMAPTRRLRHPQTGRGKKAPNPFRKGLTRRYTSGTLGTADPSR